MKKIFAFIVIAALFAACKSSTKLMQNGDYDEAINKSIKKLKRDKNDNDEVLTLEEAYSKANARDKDRIAFLKKEGKPENWDQIFSTNSRLSQRQQNIKPLLPLFVSKPSREAFFPIVNYDNEIIEAKRNATEYFYAHAKKLLATNNVFDARQAYNELEKVKSYNGTYQDTDQLLSKAKEMGTTYVVFKMKNVTGVPLPPNFEDELTKITLSDLNREWVQYHAKEIKGMNYDYTILLNMKNISVSPEGVKETVVTESKTIEDGYTYAYEADGRTVKKDAEGNPIKIPKMKTITCNVVESYQSKKAIIAGSLDYINNSNGQLIKTDPIASENFFENRSVVPVGDINALTIETKKRLGGQPMPFPPNFDMLLRAGAVLKDMTKNIINTNKNIIK
ncbi:MAG: hypothetical protein WBM13_00180 [Bacteroidia bacterium]